MTTFFILMFIFIAILLIGGFILSALPEEVSKKAMDSLKRKDKKK